MALELREFGKKIEERKTPSVDEGSVTIEIDVADLTAERIAQVTQELEQRRSAAASVGRKNQVLDEAIALLKLAEDKLIEAGIDQLTDEERAYIFGVQEETREKIAKERISGPKKPKKELEALDFGEQGELLKDYPEEGLTPPQVAKLFGVDRHVVGSHRIIKMEKGRDYIEYGEGETRKWRKITKDGARKLAVQLGLLGGEAETGREKKEEKEEQEIAQTYPMVVAAVCEMNPKTGEFRHKTPQEVADSLLTKNEQKDKTARTRAYSRVSYHKSTFVSSVRSLNQHLLMQPSSRLLTVKQIAPLYLEIAKEQYRKKGKVLNKAWGEEVWPKIVEYFGDLTVEGFVAGVLKRFGHGAQEWEDLSSVLELKIGPKALRGLVIGAEYRVQNGSILVSPQTKELALRAKERVSKSKKRLTQTTFGTALSSEIKDKFNREQTVLKTPPEAQTPQGNMTILAFLRAREVQASIEHDVLPQIGLAKLTQIAKDAKLLEDPALETFDDWVAKMVLASKHGGPIAGEDEKKAKDENKKIIGRLCLTTENWSVPGGPKEMAGYNFLFTLMTKLDEHPSAKAKFSEITARYYGK